MSTTVSRYVPGMNSGIVHVNNPGLQNEPFRNQLHGDYFLHRVSLDLRRLKCVEREEDLAGNIRTDLGNPLYVSCLLVRSSSIRRI